MKSRFIGYSLIMSAAALSTACVGHHQHAEEYAHYTPGLGEIMAQSADRHTKLWFAGQAQNWELAAYEVDELNEGFEDAAKYHRTHKQIKQLIPELIAQNMFQPLAALEQAIKAKDLRAFTQNYANLTAGCNACHQATEFGFNRVTQPNFNPFADQAFGTAN